MSAANAIGTGAVVLTANADSLLAGLDRAEKATGKWATGTAKKAGAAAGAIDENRRAYDDLVKGGKKLSGYMADVDYTRGVGKGGLVSRVFGKGGPGALGKGFGNAVRSLGSGAARAGMGVARIGGGLLTGAATAGLGALAAAAATVKDVIESAVEFTGHLLSRIPEAAEIAQKYANIPLDRVMRIDRTQKGFDRIAAALDDFVLAAAERVAPVIERVATVVERVGFVGQEAFGALVDTIEEVVTSVLKWADETFNLGLAQKSLGDHVFAVLRSIGKGLATAYDAVKWFVGQVVRGFAEVVRAAASLLEALGADEWADKAGKIADGIAGVGKGWVDSFGEGAKGVDQFFDRVERRFAETERLRKDTGNALAGGFGRGTNEAYSIEAKFRSGNILTGQTPADTPAVKTAKEQLREAREAKRLLQKLVERSERRVPLEIVP